MYGTVERSAAARQLVDSWFAGNTPAHKSMCRLVDTDELYDYAPEVADEYAHMMLYEYGARALSALKIDVDDLYVAIAHKYGF